MLWCWYFILISVAITRTLVSFHVAYTAATLSVISNSLVTSRIRLMYEVTFCESMS